MSGAESALCDAIAARLKADAALAPWLGTPARVWAEAPAQPTYPYALVERTQSRPLKADGGGAEHRVTVRCVVQYGGVETARELTAAVREALDDAALALEAHALVSVRVAYADVFRASDGKSVLGLLRVRAVTEPLN